MTMGCKQSTPKEGAAAAATEPTNPQQGTPANKSGYTFETNEKQRIMYETLKDLERIPELDQPTTVKTYEEAPLQDVLYPLVDKHQVIMVAGAFFGDEGKGKSVDAIARHPLCNCIARVNSGENAGHTVFDANGTKFVFHLAPSALLLEGKRNFVGPECVMDPISFMEKEVGQLVKAGIDYKSRLFIGNVHIVTPYHKLLDLLTSAPNSSTLKGMAPIHASKVTKKGIRLDHIYNDEEVIRARLKRDMETYEGVLKVKGLSDAAVVQRCLDENSDGVIRVAPYVIDFAKATDKVSYLVNLYKEKVRDNENFPPRCDVAHELRTALDNGEKILLEGPQSYWLSNAREKFWESTTSADTSASGLLATAQFNFQRFTSLVINVHKTPGTSRVGIGANPSAYVPQDYFSAQNIKTLRDVNDNACTDFDAIQKLWSTSIQENGVPRPIEYTDATGTYNIGVAMSIVSSRHHGESGATTQKPRVCGLFDCVAHFEVNAVQGPYLSISALDRGDDYDKLGITIAYVYYDKDGKSTYCNGKEYKSGELIKAGDSFPSEAVLYKCYPIVKLINGWRDAPIAATKRAVGTPLPQGVSDFIATVEHFTKAKVLSVGNGPKGDNIIYLKQ
ncbi:adenylosuccinate synthetase, putative [Bodo saltans]|uniref:Adenylosuccinate synthetase n=1 Tax=Bodo saltans TaxID=75058 RepID=A0A0S4JP31_BODSA|nr:adenylosuccinate synthetase, putative [Bodo saltans]|eukprot:CUG93314.1 adenylosuccinate synthetase, putative [Bodo saltans]